MILKVADALKSLRRTPARPAGIPSLAKGYNGLYSPQLKVNNFPNCTLLLCCEVIKLGCPTLPGIPFY